MQGAVRANEYICKKRGSTNYASVKNLDIKSKSYQGLLLKSYRINGGSVNIFYNKNEGLYAKVSKKNGKSVQISKEKITGIPKEILGDIQKMKSFLGDTYLNMNKLKGGSYRVYINPRIRGGGNFRISNGILFIPDTKIEVLIYPNDYKQNPDIDTIKEYVKTWEEAGFSFNFKVINSVEDKFAERTQERAAQDAMMAEGLNSELRPNTVNQSDGITLDFRLLNTGSASTTPLICDYSTPHRIKIDLNRNNVKQDVTHEIGHALGLMHEHQRIDRDDCVYLKSQVKEGPQNYKLSGIRFGHYDFNSVMHYPNFTKKHDWENISFNETQSYGDIFSAVFLYNEARIREKLGGIKNTQLNRLQNLDNKGPNITFLTEAAVKSQNEELKKLSLEVRDIDKDLLRWATENAKHYINYLIEMESRQDDIQREIQKKKEIESERKIRRPQPTKIEKQPTKRRSDEQNGYEGLYLILGLTALFAVGVWLSPKK